MRPTPGWRRFLWRRRNAAVQSYLNGMLPGVDTDNSLSSTLSVTRGLWQNGAWSVPSGGRRATVPPWVADLSARCDTEQIVQ